MFFDTHLHVDFSTDSHMKIKEALEEAANKNIGLVITEHMDLNYPDKSMFNFNCNEYFSSFSSLKNDFLLLGIEIGMALGYEEKYKEICSKFLFDYVLGSLHFLGNYDMYYKEAYVGLNKKQAYTQYFQEMLENIKIYSFIDTLGHIDYICRYAPYDEREINYTDFSDLIDEILKAIINENIVLELNTRRLGDSNVIKALTPIYKRYYDLGGRYITLGSDAHYSRDLACNFSVAKDFADMCYLKTVYFKERKMEYI